MHGLADFLTHFSFFFQRPTEVAKGVTVRGELRPFAPDDPIAGELFEC